MIIAQSAFGGFRDLSNYAQNTKHVNPLLYERDNMSITKYLVFMNNNMIIIVQWLLEIKMTQYSKLPGLCQQHWWVAASNFISDLLRLGGKWLCPNYTHIIPINDGEKKIYDSITNQTLLDINVGRCSSEEMAIGTLARTHRRSTRDKTYKWWFLLIKANPQ